MTSFSWLLWNQIVLLEEPLEWRHLLENMQRGFFFSVRGERLLAGVVVLFGAVLEDIG